MLNFMAVVVAVWAYLFVGCWFAWRYRREIFNHFVRELACAIQREKEYDGDLWF